MWLAIAILLSVPAQQQDTADQWIRQMEKKISEAHTLSVAFEVDFLFHKDIFKGSLDLMKGNKIRLEMRMRKGRR